MQEVAAMSQSTLEMTTDLVVAQIQSSGIFPENLYDAIRHIHQNLMALKSREESGAPVAETPQAPVDWRTSITRRTITCLECGAVLKQLTGNHLRIHGLNSHTYRTKYGIPQNRPLMARAMLAKQRERLQRIRPWEKSPAYVQAQAKKAAAAKKSGRKKGTRR
jgi:predicted transcriptional regulator